MVLITPEGDTLERVIKCEWRMINNKAEYEALLLGLQTTISLGAKGVKVYNDS